MEHAQDYHIASLSQFHDLTARNVLYAALQELNSAVKHMLELISEACDSMEMTQETDREATQSAAAARAFQRRLRRAYKQMTHRVKPENREQGAQRNTAADSEDPQQPFRTDKMVTKSFHYRFNQVLQDLAKAKEMMLYAVSKADEHRRRQEEITHLQEILKQKRKELHEYTEAQIQSELQEFENRSKRKYYHQQKKAIMESKFLQDKRNMEDVIKLIERIKFTIFAPADWDESTESLGPLAAPAPQEEHMEHTSLLKCYLSQELQLQTKNGPSSDTMKVPSFHAGNVEDIGKWFGESLAEEWLQRVSPTSKQPDTPDIEPQSKRSRLA